MAANDSLASRVLGSAHPGGRDSSRADRARLLSPQRSYLSSLGCKPLPHPSAAPPGRDAPVPSGMGSHLPARGSAVP